MASKNPGGARCRLSRDLHNRVASRAREDATLPQAPVRGLPLGVPRVMGPIDLLQSFLPLACCAVRLSAAGRFPAADSQRMRRAGRKRKGSLRSSLAAEHSSASPSGLKPQGQFKNVSQEIDDLTCRPHAHPPRSFAACRGATAGARVTSRLNGAPNGFHAGRQTY